MSLTEEQLSELERLNREATPGAWEWWTSNSVRRLKSLTPDGWQHVAEAFKACDGVPCIAIQEADAELIAKTRNALPPLLSEVRQLRALEARVVEYRKALDALEPDGDCG